jgi:hypothetical protein
MAAADVGDLRPALELLHGAVEGGQPVRNERAAVGVPEEGGDATEEALVVGSPGDPLAGAKRPGGLLFVDPHRRRDVVGGSEQRGAVWVGEHGRVLGRQLVGLGRGVVLDIGGRNLTAEPLADVALGAARALGQLGRRERARPCEGSVQPEPVAQAHHDSAVAGGQVGEGARQERLQLLLVQVERRRHRVVLSVVSVER